METFNILRDGNMTKSLIKLGMPVVVAMLVMAVNNVVDTFWVARLGTLSVAAVSIAFPISLFFTGIGLTFGIGGGAYISRLLGAKQVDKAGQVASVSIITAFLMGLFTALFFYLFLPKILIFMGANNATKSLATSYSKLFIVSCVIGTINVSSGNIVVSQGASKISGMAMVFGAVVNMLLDPIFIYTLHGGVEGAAWATIIAQLLTTLIYVLYFRKSPVKVSLTRFNPTLQIYGEVIKIGISMLLLQFLQSLSISLLQNAAVRYGSEAVAAIGIVLKIVTLGTNVVFGFVKGLQPIAGYNYGAKNYGRVRESIRCSLILTTSFCIVWSLVILSFTESIIACFGDDQGVKTIAEEALRANTILFFTFGFQFVYSTLYTAMGKAKQTLLLNISRQGVFFIPAILFLPSYFGLGGVLYTQAVADILTTLLTLFFALNIHRKLKQINKTKYE
ncbi:MATE family efflux transporter [Prevotella sp. HUN102]|uniref:MATE family efflux transporter n=1 Tax=Prevotella sp. HUN102 TaxID=1392486 RepID=UPI00055BE410|nr:MATE family efflux transporter [Prevotella sp. HUN102]